MKRFKEWLVEALVFASAHVGTVVLFFFLAYNVQVFMCVVALYAFCFYVVKLPYVPVLP